MITINATFLRLSSYNTYILYALLVHYLFYRVKLALVESKVGNFDVSELEPHPPLLYSGTSLIRIALGQIKGGGIVNKYTNLLFGTDESVLFIEVALIQECPGRVVAMYILA